MIRTGHWPDHGNGDIAPLRPKLAEWSEVTFLTWKHLTEGRPERRKQLKWFVRLGVTNTETREAIAAALIKEGCSSGTPPHWYVNEVYKPECVADGC